MTRRLPCLACSALLALGLFASLGGMARAEVVAVMSASGPAIQLSKEQVADIFLGRSNRYPDGRRPVPIDQYEANEARAMFYDKFVGKSSAQVRAHWSKMIFTGRGKPPRQVADGRMAKQLIAKDPNAIGYLERIEIDATVRVVSP